MKQTCLLVMTLTMLFFSACNHSTEKIVIQDIDLAKVAPGTYDGSYKNGPVSVKLNVTVIEGRLDNIELIEHDCWKGKDAEVLLNNVVKAQSLKVDMVTGATRSSEVILKAIEDALIKGLEK